jgi:hypothetical protein
MTENDYPAEFTSFLRQEQENARDATLEDARATALEYYQGLPFGDEVEGRSQAVTRDVSEVVDFLVVGILGTIMASGKVVEFETEPEEVEDPRMAMGANGGPPMQDDPQQPPQQPQTVDYGEQATAAIQYQFLRKQKGYRILHDTLKAGLLEKFGVVKTYVETQPPVTEQRDALAGEIEIGEDGPHIGGVPVAKAEPLDDGWQPGTPAMNWRVHLEHPQPPKFCDRPVPSEYFRVSADAIDLDEAIYVGEVMPKTMSAMVQMGYDTATLEGIWNDAPSDTVVENARDSERGKDRNSIGQRTGANKMLWLSEEYPLYDLDGDGIAERLFVHRIGNHILRAEPVDEQPYSGWSPFPMQHRLVGQSVADKTMDIQRIRSVLLRQGLDSLYLSNSPRTLVEETSITVDTIDDLLTVRPGGLIRYRGNAPAPLVQQDTSDTAFQGMEMMSNERESRVGVTRQSQGLNPDSINKTASGLAMNIAASQQIELYICRNFAEMIVAQVFAKRYRLMKRYGQPFRMKIQGKYVEVDPRAWPDEVDMSINVGLGTGNKDQKLQYRMSLLGVQQQIIAGGLPIVGPEEIYQNVKALVEDSGLGVASDYVKDPATIPPQPPKPDPEAAKAEADAQTQQAKDAQAHQQAMTALQLQQERQQAEAALKQQANEQAMQIKAADAQQAADLATAKAQKEAELADQRQAFDMNLAERRFAFDQRMAERRHEMEAANAAASLPSNRPGGSLAE